jgi:hypothetical protein
MLIIALQPLSINPAFLRSPFTGHHRARQLSASSADSRLSTSPPPMPVCTSKRVAHGFVPLRTPSPAALSVPAISRRHFPPKAAPMTPSGDRAFTVSLPTPAAARGAPSHIRLVPVSTLDEADAAVLVSPPAREDEKPKSLLLVGPENLGRVRRGASTFGRNVRVHPYRIVRVAVSPAAA